jgi:hypothetical protein
MNEITKPAAATEDQPRKITTIVIGGDADGKIVPVGPGGGSIAGSTDKYILAFSGKGGDKRYFYLLESLRNTGWEERALEVWKDGARAADVEARPSVT